jgi:hypothetical protein
MNTGPTTVSVAIVDTAQHTLARNALLHSLKSFDFKQVLIFSNVQEAWGDLPIITVPPIQNMGEYNQIITRELANHINSDYCLVIQYDGFIINPDQFSPHFYFYDYIGAPWHHFGPPTVGNGGFSWRSRKLIETVASMPYTDATLPEDLFICLQQRPLLEATHGIAFAPADIAAHFSVESIPVRFPTFGFHGIFHLPDIYRNEIDFLVENLNPVTAEKWQHMLLPMLERISSIGARRLRERINQLHA